MRFMNYSNIESQEEREDERKRIQKRRVGYKRWRENAVSGTVHKLGGKTNPYLCVPRRKKKRKSSQGPCAQV